MKKTGFCVFLLLTIQFSGRAQQLSATEFQYPDREYAPMTWWHWVNGHITREGILKDLAALHKAGIRGVQVFNAHMYMPRGPIEYNTDAWLDMMLYAIHVCDSLGLKFVTMNCAGWSGSGGPWIDPDRAMKKLVYAEFTVTGGKKIQTALPLPDTVSGYVRDIAVLAIPARYAPGQIPNLRQKILMESPNLYSYNIIREGLAIPPGEIIDLSAFVKTDGQLSWKAPKGQWTIMRFCYTLTGKKNHPAAYGGEGYEVDKLNPAHVQYQFQQSLGKLLDETKQYHGNTFEGILFDSYEAHFQNWTENLPQEFSNKYGYSIMDYLPLFSGRYVETAAKSEQVLSDFRNLLDNMLASHYYGTMQHMAHDRSLIAYAECQGGPVNTSMAINYVDIPMNEFWNPDAIARLSKMKLTGSLANNRNKHLVAAEAFTSRPEHGKWQNTPWTLKKPGDLAFTTGINRFCFHTFVHQPVDYAVPGFTMGRYGTLFSRHSTWWKMGREWIEYLTRCQYLLQQGRSVADICFLFNSEVRYAFPDSIVHVPPGYDYSVIYPQDLIHAQSTEGGLRLQSGSRFKLIVLPDNWLVKPSVAEKLVELVKGGCHLMCSGSALEVLGIDSGPEKESEYTIESGNGRIYVNTHIQSAVKQVDVGPDMSIEGSEHCEKFYFTHRETQQEHIYFISNQMDNSVDVDVAFNVNRLIPQVWDPISGSVESDFPYRIKGRTITVPLSFDPYGSLFVVFPKDKQATMDHVVPSAPITNVTQRIVGPWQLTFSDKNQMGDIVYLDTLSSLHISRDKRGKYYSGIMTYATEFSLPEMEPRNRTRCILDLGDIYSIAEVRVNGEEVGVVWKKPYNIDVTRYLEEGSNKLEVTIANTWINRIIGDESLPTDIVYDHEGSIFTNGRLKDLPAWFYSGSKPDSVQRYTFTTWQHYNEDSELPPSGLVGPVRVVLSGNPKTKE
jgi:hypothetical protein